MRLTVNAVADYPDLGYDEIEWLKSSIFEDVDDCLRFTGIVHGSGIIVEVKVES